MKVLVIGSGGREHALCWKLRQSPLLTDLFCAPGNPGVATVADRVPIGVDDLQRLAEFASEMSIDLTVVGPELPLTLGLADEFAARGLAVFGPPRHAAELEGSKVFAKQFMARHDIPTAPFVVAHDAEDAWNAVLDLGLPVVLKADGLAAGKGVVIPRDEEELKEALAIFFDERRFGDAGARVVVEKFLEGEEVSFIALSDGERVLPLASSKDYKRIGEGDSGPNTGGMGAHSPAGVLGPEDAAWILDQVMRRTVAGMAEENRPFAGVLYAGLILTDDGPRVLEFNVRFGDPETQPLMLRLEDDLLPVLAEAAAGQFTTQRLRFRQEAAACVVLASAPYPERPETGEPIVGLEAAAAHDGVEIFHAGTSEKDGRVVTAGGRVLNVCAAASGLREALRRAYEAAAELDWPAKRMRGDIGRRLLESLPQD
ncbi:MAG: phosphoribosylamine--glycine ligase [Thermoanaerobaculia bacterium]